jgi:hypothetical protein
VSDEYDSSIPMLTEILVAGDASKAWHARGESAYGTDASAGVDTDTALLPDAAVPIAPIAPAGRQVAADPGHDAQVIAERLRGRFAHYLTGDGRALIEERCRTALNDHTSWLVGQITREVALALETQITDWVREAVREEIGRRPRDE